MNLVSIEPPGTISVPGGFLWACGDFCLIRTNTGI